MRVTFTGDANLDQDIIKLIAAPGFSDLELIISGKLHEDHVKALCSFLGTNNTVNALKFDNFILPESAIPTLCAALNQNTSVTYFTLNNVTTEKGMSIDDYKLNDGKTINEQLSFIQDGNLCIQNRNSTQDDEKALEICTTRKITPPMNLRVDIDDKEYFKKLENDDVSPVEFSNRLLEILQSIPQRVQNHERIQRLRAVVIFGGTRCISTDAILKAANLEYSNLSLTLNFYDRNKLAPIKLAIDAFEKQPEIISAQNLFNALNSVKSLFSNDPESNSVKNVKRAVEDAENLLKSKNQHSVQHKKERLNG